MVLPARGEGRRRGGHAPARPARKSHEAVRRHAAASRKCLKRLSEDRTSPRTPSSSVSPSPPTPYRRRVRSCLVKLSPRDLLLPRSHLHEGGWDDTFAVGLAPAMRACAGPLPAACLSETAAYPFREPPLNAVTVTATGTSVCMTASPRELTMAIGWTLIPRRCCRTT